MSTHYNILSAGEEFEADVVRNVQKNIGYVFLKPELLDQALTHSSWANEFGRAVSHNERLEFLGDAVFELCVSDTLYHMFPNAREGNLTSLRSTLVNEGTLANIARERGVAAALKIGRGEDAQGGRDRDAVLADALEAIIAAVYEDGGFESAKKVTARLFQKYWPATYTQPKTLDCKSRLQEVSQKLFRGLPHYTMDDSHGPEHARIFEVTVTLPDGSHFHAAGSSCKKAEQTAAALALDTLTDEYGKKK